MKPWINMAFLYDEDRLKYLEQTLLTIYAWPVSKMNVSLVTDFYNLDVLADKILPDFPDVNIHGVDVFGHDPRILQWQHKDEMEEFVESEFTHFIYTDADLEIFFSTMEYWVQYRELLKGTHFIPGTFRYEHYEGTDRCLDTTYRTDLDTLPLVKIEDEVFFSPQEPFQGVLIMDKEMAKEHISSPYFRQDSIGVFGFGYGETAISGYIFFNNVPKSWHHRVLIPVENYQRCLIRHLPANYAANAHKEHGKIDLKSFFSRVQDEIRRRG